MSDFENLSYVMQLSSYQTQVLKENYEKYDITKLVKRGGVLCVPYAKQGGVKNFLYRVLYGAKADLVGKNKMLAQNKRIKFYAWGYYTTKCHGQKFFSNNDGCIIPRCVFKNKVCNKNY